MSPSNPLSEGLGNPVEKEAEIMQQAEVRADSSRYNRTDAPMTSYEQKSFFRNNDLRRNL